MFESQRLYFRQTLSRLLEQCKNMRALKQIHTQIITSPYLPKTDNYFLTSRLLFFCAISNFGSLSYAADVFRLIENPNVYVYNIMIRAYASRINGGDEPSSCRSLILYKQMLCDGIKPDCITFPFVLKECTRRFDRNAGRCIHGQGVKFGIHHDLFIGNSMISLYSACGVLKSAREVFDGMLERDVVSWNAMITGYLRGGDLDAAFDLFKKMERRNIITWNSIITGFVQGGRAKEALEFFHEMQSMCDDSIRPDKITVASVLSACASLGVIDHGKWVHSYLKRNGLECDVVVATALVDMYGKCGCVGRAVEVFREMPKKDILAWTAMISVFALHGYGKEAFDLLEEMVTLGIKPNQVTFVALLSACAHSGLVDKGRWCFNMMRRVYSIEPQLHHYACMVDILSRAGLFEAAEELIRNMPIKPDVYVWGALLGGCQMHVNVELGEKVAKDLIDLEPLNHAFYVNLCDLYGKTGRIGDKTRIRALMKERGIKKAVQGCSSIEVDGIVREFSVEGSPDVAMEQVAWVLNGLNGEMKIHWDMVDINEKTSGYRN